VAHSNTSDDREPVLDAFISLSERLEWNALPQPTRDFLKLELLDYMGGAVAGRVVAGMPKWLRNVVDSVGGGNADLIGGGRTAGQAAALCNGYFGHVLEFDDTHDKAVLHAGSAAIPAAMAAAGMRGGLTGRNFCEAVLLGIELTCRLGIGTRLNLVEGGWIYGTLLGHFGATLSAARIMDNRSTVIKNAFGIVYCLACGNHQSTREGASTKHVQPGFAASNAILASLIASGELEGIKQPLTGEDGLSRVYLHNRFDSGLALEGLGQRFEADRLSFKPYPTCRFTHSPVSAALLLRRKLGNDLARVERLELVLNAQAHDIVARATPERLRPQSRMPAQFSAQWCVAATLVHGELTPRQLVEEVPPQPAVQAMIDRISCSGDTTSAREIGGCTLRAHGPFGVCEVHEPNAKGHPENPLGRDELMEKFLANTSIAGISRIAAKELAAGILAIDEMDDMVPLLRKITSAVGSAQTG
jgi:2-methylcitrate dehydratase PrpD